MGRWRYDDFIAYIELDGLGHWGEINVHSDAGIHSATERSS